MRRRIRLTILILLLFLTASATTTRTYADEDVKQLKTAWSELIAEDTAQLKKLTSLKRYNMLISQIREADKACEEHVYQLRLRCTGVIERQKPAKLFLVHGQYVGPEKDMFGAGATVGIWTQDRSAAESLDLEEEFNLRGPIFFHVSHASFDDERVATRWRQSDINTSVAHIRHDLTGFDRQVRIYMKNPTIHRLRQ